MVQPWPFSAGSVTVDATVREGSEKPVYETASANRDQIVNNQ
jgi:hypothetical protein